MIIGLTIILLMVLFLPFISRSIEHNLELFLLVMGVVAVIVADVLTGELLRKALAEPLHISLAVIVAGILFRLLHRPFSKSVRKLGTIIPFRLFVALIIIILGLLSSVITAIIAALVLVAIVTVLGLPRKDAIRFVILACFSIGLGAVLTPIGEPLSTIATSKLDADFFYLFRLIGPAVIPGVLAFGLLAACIVRPPERPMHIKEKPKHDKPLDIFTRGVKVYVFVMALTFLGAGFEPFIRTLLLDIPPTTLYWLNMISAVLDNATLAAAEISPEMEEATIQSILLGLLISGGMLIPGNIPNIIAANKLQITSGEWAKFGIPIGLVTMILYFIGIILFV